MPEVHNNDPLKEIKDEINKNSKDHTSEFDPEDIRSNSALAAACYIPILFLLALILRPNSRFARFHANQGLILLIVDIIIGIGVKLVSFVPIISLLTSTATSLLMFAFFLYGFINTLNGKAKELPFIGGLKILK